jgi:hypothetical protein
MRKTISLEMAELQSKSPRVDKRQNFFLSLHHQRRRKETSHQVMMTLNKISNCPQMENLSDSLLEKRFPGLLSVFRMILMVGERVGAWVRDMEERNEIAAQIEAPPLLL